MFLVCLPLCVWDTSGQSLLLLIVVFSMNWGLWVMLNSHDPRQILLRTSLLRKDLGAGMLMKDEHLPAVSWSRKQAKIQPCSLNSAMPFLTAVQAKWSAAWLTSLWDTKYSSTKSLRIGNRGEHKDMCPACHCVLLVFIFFFFLPQDEREARENVKREQDEAYRISLEADRAKVWESGREDAGTWGSLQVVKSQWSRGFPHFSSAF